MASKAEQSSPLVSTGTPSGPPEGVKPCCACPATRKPRDDCIVMYGEEKCTDFIEAHKQCLRQLGFKID